MRAKAEKLQAKQAGFTLLELLVVVAILAIIAGAVISSLDGQEELAAQKTTVHTMAALEEGFAIYNATAKRTLPGNLDSLLCDSTVDASAGTAALGTVAAATSTKLGGLSNVARVGGGMTADLAGSLELVDAPQGAVNVLADAGLTSLRYVEGQNCDLQTANLLHNTGLDEELVEVTKPNLIFRTPLIENGTDWEFGAGAPLDLSTYVADASTDAVPMLFMEEPAEITNDETDVVAVFGIGPDSDIVGEIVKRAPSDGNGGPDKYSNFSVAVKIAQCEAGGEAEDGFGSGDGCDSANWVYTTPEVVAILDAGGDGYDDEVAEARGNEEE
jgi:prepilin-type N-terminal cleavage/methylation domain-containing protein